MRKLIGIIAFVAFGCAPMFTIVPKDKSEQEYRADLADCQAKGGAAAAAYPTLPGTAFDARNEAFRNCMLGKGYKQD